MWAFFTADILILLAEKATAENVTKNLHFKKFNPDFPINCEREQACELPNFQS